MNWDQFLEEPGTGETGGPLPLLPESQPGKPWVGEIVKATVVRKDFDWAKDERRNPDGFCIVIEVAVAKYRTFEATIPCHYTAKVAALCKSARVHPPGGGDWDEQALVGRSVTFESVTVMSPRGTEYVRVNKWLPNAEPLPANTAASKPAAKPVARSQSAKAHQAFTANAEAPDDIPF